MNASAAPPEVASGAAAPRRVVVVGDFVCPWSYIAVPLVARLVAEYDAEAVWRPHWLHPEVPPEGVPIADRVRREATAAWIRELEPELAAQMVFPDRLRFSFRAFEALEMAQDHGVADPFVAAIFDALWLRGEDIGDVEVVAAVGGAVGLDRAEVAGALTTHTYAERALAAVASARRNAITATPTFFLGRTRVEGWHYYEVVQSILEQQGFRRREAGVAG